MHFVIGTVFVCEREEEREREKERVRGKKRGNNVNATFWEDYNPAGTMLKRRKENNNSATYLVAPI